MSQAQLENALIRSVGDLGGAMKAAHHLGDYDLYEELQSLRAQICEIRDQQRQSSQIGESATYTAGDDIDAPARQMNRRRIELDQERLAREND